MLNRSQLLDYPDSLINPADIVAIISYPANGGRRAVPPGKTIVNLKTGIVERPDAQENLAASLNSLKFEYAQSCFLWVDSDIDIEVKNRSETRGRFVLSQCNPTILQYFPMDKIEINAALPFNIYALFSTARQSPQIVNGITSHQERYGTITTTNPWVNIPLGPTEGGELAAAYKKDYLQVNGIGSKVFLVHNTGANGADVNLQLQHLSGKLWVNSAITGASLNIPTGDNARIEDGTFTGFARLRTRSTVAGSPTTLEIQYRGFTGVR